MTGRRGLRWCGTREHRSDRHRGRRCPTRTKQPSSEDERQFGSRCRHGPRRATRRRPTARQFAHQFSIRDQNGHQEVDEGPSTPGAWTDLRDQAGEPEATATGTRLTVTRLDRCRPPGHRPPPRRPPPAGHVPASSSLRPSPTKHGAVRATVAGHEIRSAADLRSSPSTRGRCLHCSARTPTAAGEDPLDGHAEAGQVSR
jgi:hypothetical protein